MKKLLVLAIAVMLLLGLSTSALAAQNEVAIVIDNQNVQFTDDSGKPFLDANGRTQVPLRIVMEQYGCTVAWDGVNNSAVITKNGTEVVVPIGADYIIVMGNIVPMDTSSQLVGGRTYLPIRAVLEAFDADVTWSNGTVSVTSPNRYNFDNIYINDDGELIFELANGQEINAGNVSDGKDGKDGISVTDAYIDQAGNLMIELSSGRTINAGNINAGGAMSNLTFADYSVGTKFYLLQPSGAFDVTVYLDNTPYTVHFDNVYYQLTAKYDYTDGSAWKYQDGRTEFYPYKVTFHIEGNTDAALAGNMITVAFWDTLSGSYSWDLNIADDGSFSINHDQLGWLYPKSLTLRRLSVDKQVIDLAPSEYLPLIVGDWAASPDDIVTVHEDGKITYKGSDYYPEYEYQKYINSVYATIESPEEGEFYFNLRRGEMETPFNDKTYFKGRTWNEVQLTKANFLDYYEYKESFSISYDLFNSWTRAEIVYSYQLKDQYIAKLDENLCTKVGVKIEIDRYKMPYSIDSGNNTYSVTEPGTFMDTRTTTEDSGRWFDFITLDRAYMYPDDGGKADFATKIELLDATGTLYFIND